MCPTYMPIQKRALLTCDGINVWVPYICMCTYILCTEAMSTPYRIVFRANRQIYSVNGNTPRLASCSWNRDKLRPRFGPLARVRLYLCTLTSFFRKLTLHEIDATCKNSLNKRSILWKWRFDRTKLWRTLEVCGQISSLDGRPCKFH